MIKEGEYIKREMLRCNKEVVFNEKNILQEIKSTQ